MTTHPPAYITRQHVQAVADALNVQLNEVSAVTITSTEAQITFLDRATDANGDPLPVVKTTRTYPILNEEPAK